MDEKQLGRQAFKPSYINVEEKKKSTIFKHGEVEWEEKPYISKSFAIEPFTNSYICQSRWRAGFIISQNEMCKWEQLIATVTCNIFNYKSYLPTICLSVYQQFSDLKILSHELFPQQKCINISLLNNYLL